MQRRFSRRTRRYFCCALFVLCACTVFVHADGPVLTTVHDIVYRADGVPASGSIVISWPAFTTSAGYAVAAGTRTVQLGTGGTLHVPLAPNAGSVPQGTYYKAVLKLDPGPVSTEYWVIPQTATATLAAIRTQLAPPAAAMQAATREWVDLNTVHKAGDETVNGTKTFAASPRVPVPTVANDAASKEYVDTHAADGLGYVAENLANKNQPDGYAGLDAGGGINAHIGATTPNTGSFTSLAVSKGISLTGPYSISDGLLAEYHFDQGSGTQVTDYSGNGNHATFGTIAPVWNSRGGVDFGENNNAGSFVELPGFINSAVTITTCQFVEINNLIGMGNPTNQLTLGNSNANSVLGVNIFTYVSRYGIGIVQNGATAATGTTENMYGFHCVTAILRTAPLRDLLYVDGRRITAYTSQNSSSEGIQTTGTYRLGSTGWGSGSSYLTGTMYYAAFHSNAKSDSEIAALHNGITEWLTAKGIATKPIPNSSATRQVVCSGDSITHGSGLATTPCGNYLALVSGWSVTEIGLPGQFAATAVGSGDQYEDRYFSPRAPANVVVFWRGTNDIAGGVSSQNTLNYIATYCRARKLKGWNCFVGTMISRSGYDTGKNSLNGLIRSYAMTFSDGIVDFAAIPQLGADGASGNATYFQGDGIHPTQAGQQLIGVAISNKINQYFGVSQINPCSTSAPTYTSTWDCSWVRADPATNNVVVTLPTAIAMTGTTFHVINIRGGGSNTVTVVPASGELINGSSSGVVVPNASGLVLISVLNSDASSGNHWEVIGN